MKRHHLTIAIFGILILTTGCAGFAHVSGSRRAHASGSPASGEVSPGKEFRFNYPAGEFIVDYREGQYQIEIDQYANPPKKYRSYTHDKADNLAVIEAVGLLLWNQPKLPSYYAGLKKGERDYTPFFFFVDANTGKHTRCEAFFRRSPNWSCLAIGLHTKDDPPETTRVLLMMADWELSQGHRVFRDPPRVMLIENGKLMQQWEPILLERESFQWVGDRLLFVSKDENDLTWGHWVDLEGNIESLPGFIVTKQLSLKNQLRGNAPTVVLVPDEFGGYGLIKKDEVWLPDGALSLYPAIRTEHSYSGELRGSKISGWFVAYPNEDRTGVVWGWASPGFETLGPPVWSDLRVVPIDADFYNNETYDLFVLKKIEDGRWWAYAPPSNKNQLKDISKYPAYPVGWDDFDKTIEKAVAYINLNTANARKGAEMATEQRIQRFLQQRRQKAIEAEKKMETYYQRRQAEIERQNDYTRGRRAGRDRSSLSDEAMQNFQNMRRENLRRQSKGERPWNAVWSSGK